MAALAVLAALAVMLAVYASEHTSSKAVAPSCATLKWSDCWSASRAQTRTAP